MSDLNLPTRKSLRMRGFDYATSTAYFVTVCTNLRLPVFGTVINGEMRLSPLGQMIHDTWQKLPEFYEGFYVDEFVVMPNHFHAIVVLKIVVGAAGADAPSRVGPQKEISTGLHQNKNANLPLPSFMRRFKSFTTNAYQKGAKDGHWREFSKILWQRGYHDHIVRDDIELAKIRMYIQDNSIQWAKDEENPERK